MKRHPYAPADVKALTPLLGSISRELEERGEQLEALEVRLAELRNSTFSHDQELRALEAEASTHRRELRLCRAELEHLGCSVLGTTPLTIRIPTRVGSTRRSLVWRHHARHG
jgi:hypothetical protein